jgi:hypothetical protein
MRFLAITVYATAAVCAFLLATGVSAPPHRVAPGTPLNHTLALGAYRFAFLVEPRPDGTTALSPEMATLHKALALAGIPMTHMPGMEASEDTDLGPLFTTSGLHPAQDFAIAIALLVIAWPRLPRPTLLALGEVALARIAGAQWRSPLILGPPRA